MEVGYHIEKQSQNQLRRLLTWESKVEDSLARKRTSREEKQEHTTHSWRRGAAPHKLVKKLAYTAK